MSSKLLVQKSRSILPLLALLAAVTSASPAQAQTAGRIVGRVVDAGSGRPVPTAQVYIADGSLGTLTDIDGRFLLVNVPAGPVDIMAQIIGFGTKTVTGVEVVAGQVTSLDILLEQTAVELEAITVEAVREQGSAAVLLDARRESNSMVDAVGSEEIARSTAGDAADVATRMSGVTVSEGKYVYVRGLGDRYSQTSFNGSPLPSPEPEKEVVPLDLFPSGFLESLTTQKSYTPDRPADFAGGTVEIQTKEFPEQFTLQVGMGSSFNDRSQFKDSYLRYPGGGTDWLGKDDGTRGLPSEVNDLLGGLKGDPLPADPALVRQVGLGFPRTFTPYAGSTPLNRAFDVAVGGSTELGDRRLGFFLAGNYGDSYLIRDRERELKWTTSGFNPDIEDPNPNVDYSFQRGTRTVAFGVISNLTLNLAPEHQLGVRFNYNRNTTDEARVFDGVSREDIGGRVEASRLRYQARNLGWVQLRGEHGLFANSRLDWKVSGARAMRDEPSLREALYVQDTDEEYYLERIGVSGRNFFSDLTDDDFTGTVDWELPFGLGSRTALVKVGGMARDRSRDFASRRFQWNFLSGIIQNIEEPLSDDENIVGRAPAPGQLALNEIVEPGGQYEASDRRYGGYMMFTLPAGERWEFVLGARVESYDLQITSRDSTLTDRSQVDFVPSVNVLWNATRLMNFRAAFSRTVNRPEFRELSPFQFTEATSLRQLFGNPALESATITAADLRWDFFPTSWELFSVSGFYKHMKDPIEQVFVAAASTAYSFQNAKAADILGVELDAQFRLGRWSPSLQGFSLNTNLALIQSDVEVRETGTFIPTTLSRPLEGQAPYVLNLGLNWGSSGGGWTAGVFYNRIGERLTAAGGSGVPDIYLQPRNSVDASLRVPLGRSAYMQVKGTNLLDEDFLSQQSANGITQLQQVYATGRTVAVKFGWQIY
jgi:hypothetical protein